MSRKRSVTSVVSTVGVDYGRATWEGQWTGLGPGSPGNPRTWLAKVVGVTSGTFGQGRKPWRIVQEDTGVVRIQVFGWVLTIKSGSLWWRPRKCT